MKICVLASGSEGNVTYVETNQHKILLDIGTTVKYVKDRLSELSVRLEEIDYVFITHVHADHVKGLKTLIKSYHPYICVSPIMFAELPELHNYDKVFLYDRNTELDDAKIEIIKTSHDASDSRGFIITSNNASVVYLTDTGYINQRNFELLKNKQLYLFESNHDIEMLINGPYPKFLKDRVLGPYGHLSNKDSSVYLAKLIGKDTKKIVLMHLSQKNNTEEKALETIKEVFAEYEIQFNSKNICCARQKEKSELIEI